MKNRQLKQMKSGCKLKIELSEEIWLEIVARLPFRNIMRFKVVCRGWKRFIETEYFRRAFMFAHRNSSSSWSMMHHTSKWSYGEVLGFYGCERYGIPRSLDSYIPYYDDDDEMVSQITTIACVDGLVLIQDTSGEEVTYSVGNPVLNQWIQLPPHLSKGLDPWVRPTSLVTRVDEDGIVVEYKVVFMNVDRRGLRQIEVLRFEIYSSETRRWIQKQVSCPRIIVSLNYKECLSLNEKLYWIDKHAEAFVTYDFFFVTDDEQQQQQQCRFIPFPNAGHDEPRREICQFDRAYSTCGGFLVYMSIIKFQLRLWKFEEYTWRWQLMQEIDTRSFSSTTDKYYPLAMHLFENHTIYMGIENRIETENTALVSIDLKTLKCTHHTKSTYSDAMFFHYLDKEEEIFYIPQFILPKWMGSVSPLPPV